MIAKNLFIPAVFLLIVWSPISQSIVNSQLSVDISAQSVARISIYYKGLPVPEGGVDFVLPVNGISQKIERTSADFYLVGNVDQADVFFEEDQFVLHQVNGGNAEMLLYGNFIFNGLVTSANQVLRIPVLNDISQGTSANGLKIKFSSQFASGNYTKGDYANVFTLFVKPDV